MDLLMTLKAKWAIPEKIQTGAWCREDIFFEKETLEFLDLSLYRYFVQRKESFTCGSCAKFNKIALQKRDSWVKRRLKEYYIFWSKFSLKKLLE